MIKWKYFDNGNDNNNNNVNENENEILQKAKERYSKKKAAEYYQQNKEDIKEKSRNCYKNMSEQKKN